MTQFLQRDSPIPRFFAYPKFLLTLDLSETAKMIYMLLLDRAKLSMQKEGWQDEQGRVFIHYTIQSLATAICKSEMTVKNALKALEQRGLIYRQRQGAGMPNRIFVKVQTGNCPARGQKTVLPEGQFLIVRQKENCPQIKTRVKRWRNIMKIMSMRRETAYDTHLYRD